MTLPRALDDDAHASGRASPRVIDVLRQKEHLALSDPDPLFAAVFDHMHENMAVELIKNFVPGVDVEVVSGVGPVADLEDEIRVLEHLFVADGAQGARQ